MPTRRRGRWRWTYEDRARSPWSSPTAVTGATVITRIGRRRRSCLRPRKRRERPPTHRRPSLAESRTEPEASRARCVCDLLRAANVEAEDLTAHGVQHKDVAPSVHGDGARQQKLARRSVALFPDRPFSAPLRRVAVDPSTGWIGDVDDAS